MASNNRNIDEFGRDLSLKPKEYHFNPILCGLDRFKGMSWVEINRLIEEEEETEKAKKVAEKRLVERVVLLKVHEERKQLYQQGLYELEEGEELDM